MYLSMNVMGILRFSNYLKFRKFRGTFNGLSILVLFFFLYHGEEIVQTPFSWLSYSKLPDDLGSQDDSSVNISQQSVRGRKIQENEYNYNTHFQNGVIRRRRRRDNIWLANGDPSLCSGLHKHKGYSSKCEYLKANQECNAGGFFNYLHFLYCDCQKYQALGYFGLAIWLVALFYLLGNTASDYFCCSLERLSILLRLSPTLAGVTLLPLGNGAPDVFSSIAAFMGRDSDGVGLNSVLGGAVFVTSVVAGTISLCVADRSIRIDKKCFVRDVCFFMVALFFLLAILIVGELSVGGAIAFVSIYVVYALFVAATEMIRKNAARKKLESIGPLLPVSNRDDADNESVRASLLESDSSSVSATPAVADGFPFPCPEDKLPHWVWATNVAIYSNESAKTSAHSEYGWIQWNEEEHEMVTDQIPNSSSSSSSSSSCSALCWYFELPLTLPRRLTIPVVDEERWSKFYAVCSAFFAPLLLALLWNTRDVNPFNEKTVYLIGGATGAVLGLLALLFTRSDQAPQRCLLPWVLGGFFMSIIWFYIVANELVAVLVALGVIFGISPSLLALTVLAWGNSIGDLMSNTAMAMNGGKDGVQIAISGCYAGPMFNTLAGLGVSMLLGAWYKRPAAYTVPKDYTLYFTLGFLLLSLVWALIVLPCSNMRPNKLLGIGLMAIYLAFLSLRATIAIGDASSN